MALHGEANIQNGGSIIGSEKYFKVDTAYQQKQPREIIYKDEIFQNRLHKPLYYTNTSENNSVSILPCEKPFKLE